MTCDLINSTLMSTTATPVSPQPVSLISKAADHYCPLLAAMQHFYCSLSQLPAPTDTSRVAKQMDLLNAYLENNSWVNLTAKDIEYLWKWWKGIVERNLQISRCFYFEDNSNIMEASFICAPESCPGHDVTLLGKGRSKVFICWNRSQ